MHFLNKHAVLLVLLSIVTFSVKGQAVPYLKSGIGFQHLFIPSDTFKTKNDPLYSIGIGLSLNKFGVELNGYTAKYSSSDLTYHYLNPDFYFTNETYKQTFTRRGIDLTINYHYNLNSKFVFWLICGVSYYQFKPSVETKDDNVRDEIQTFNTYWKEYSKITPILTLRASYSPLPYINIFVEGGYDITMFKAGLLIGNITHCRPQHSKSSTVNSREEKPVDRTANVQPPPKRPSSSTDVSVSPKQHLKYSNGKFKGIKWEPVNTFGNQIFPSFLVSINRHKSLKLTDAGNILGFTMNARKKGIVLNWEIECSDATVISKQSGLVGCDAVGRGGKLLPAISWNTAALKKNLTDRPLTIYYRLIDPATGNKMEQSSEVNLKAFSEWVVVHNTAYYETLLPTLVDPNNPEIESIVKKAVQTKMTDGVKGYKKTTAELHLQVAAIWRALSEAGYDFKPSHYSIDSGMELKTVTARTIDKIIKAKKGNTLEAALLFASLLKNIGIRPAIISISGNYYAGYYEDASTVMSISVLDLSMIKGGMYTTSPKSSVEKNKSRLATALPKGSKLSELNKAYYLEFMAARAEGDRKIDEAKVSGSTDQFSILDVDRSMSNFSSASGQK